MKLLWIRYKKTRKLVLELGYHQGKLICLDTNKLSSSDKSYIRIKDKYLEGLDMASRIRLLRDHRPSVMPAYRTLSMEKVIIEDEYILNSAKPKSA